MLQSFVWMCNITMLRYIGFEEIFSLFNFPDTKSCSIVDLMLKKNWHVSSFRFKIAFLNRLGKVELVNFEISQFPNLKTPKFT